MIVVATFILHLLYAKFGFLFWLYCSPSYHNHLYLLPTPKDSLRTLVSFSLICFLFPNLTLSLHP